MHFCKTFISRYSILCIDYFTNSWPSANTTSNTDNENCYDAMENFDDYQWDYYNNYSYNNKYDNYYDYYDYDYYDDYDDKVDDMGIKAANKLKLNSNCLQYSYFNKKLGRHR